MRICALNRDLGWPFFQYDLKFKKKKKNCRRNAIGFMGYVTHGLFIGH